MSWITYATSPVPLDAKGLKYAQHVGRNVQDTTYKEGLIDPFPYQRTIKTEHIVQFSDNVTIKRSSNATDTQTSPI